MKHLKRLICIVIIVSSLVACSTTRKAVRTETLTQTSTMTADTGSLHATTVKTDSTSKESWEEIVVEWEKDETAGTYENETATPTKNEGEKTGLGKMLEDIRKSGATKATIRKGETVKAASKTETDSTSERQVFTTQNTQTKEKTEETVKKGRSVWTYLLWYIIVTTLMAGIGYAIRKLVNRL